MNRGSLSCFSSCIPLYPLVIYPGVVVSGSTFSFESHLSMLIPTNSVHRLYSSLLLCYCDRTLIKSNLERRGFFFSRLTSCSPSMREVEAGTAAETIEQCCLPTCSPWLAQHLSSTSQDHLVNGWQHAQWLGPPLSISNPENAHRQISWR